VKNVTVTLEEEVAHWVRIRAAEESQSVSRFLGDMLKRQMVEEKRYEEALDRFLSRTPSRISDSGVYPSREELYDRPDHRALHRDLDHLAGTWSEEKAAAFDAALAEQRGVDPDP